MNELLLSRNLHNNHIRKLSEIRQSRSRFFARDEQKHSSGHKGHYLKKMQELSIQQENHHLADRFRSIYSRKSNYSSCWNPHEAILMRNPSRVSFYERVASENQQLLKRLVSQKSQYRFNGKPQERLSPPKQTLLRSRVRSKTLHNEPDPHDYELLPEQTDDFNQRRSLVHVGATVLGRLCMVEISRSNRFDYITLDFVTMAVKYKLRLSKEAGERTLDMYEANPEAFYSRRIVMERNEVFLVIIWGAFVRKYPFRRLMPKGTYLKPKSHLRTKTENETQSDFHQRRKSRNEFAFLNETELPQLKNSRDDLYQVFKRVSNPTPSSSQQPERQ